MKLRILVTFLLAAPLLNPYIILLSFTVIDIKYGILRIVASFILAVSAGYVLEFSHKHNTIEMQNPITCNDQTCIQTENDVYLKTFFLFKSIIPYIIIGGLIAIGLDFFSSKATFPTIILKDNPFFGNMIAVLVGIPFYFCNGTDVLLLKSLFCSGLLHGTGIAFSLTSTAICITSILMLIKFLGKWLTFLLIGHIIAITLILSHIINLLLN